MYVHNFHLFKVVLFRIDYEIIYTVSVFVMQTDERAHNILLVAKVDKKALF